MSRNALKRFLEHKTISVPAFASALVVSGGWLWARAALGGVKEPLILHYANRGGITQTGSFSSLTAVFLVAILVIIVNSTIAFGLEERDLILGKLVSFSTLFLAILMFIGFAAIISVN